MKTKKEIFESTVKNTRFEQLSASSDIGQGIIMGYIQCQKDNEEAKQETHICKYCNYETSQPDDKCYAKPKQETLEEAAERFYPIKTTDLICSPKLVRDGFKEGAKWQQERMYSEEELLDVLKDYDREFKIDTFSYTKSCSFTIEEWFEQFKNK